LFCGYSRFSASVLKKKTKAETRKFVCGISKLCVPIFSVTIVGMRFLELVQKRQSCRRYADRPVPREMIDRCIDAARLAPSACNSQPWSFVVVDDPFQRDVLAKAAFSGLYSMNRFAGEAPVLIVVITERSKYVARLGGQIRGIQYSLIDVGIACEHLILQAAEDGLGTCWLGWFDEKAVKRCLGLSKKKRIDIIISLGYPEDDTIRNKLRQPLDDVRSFSSGKPT